MILFFIVVLPDVLVSVLPVVSTAMKRTSLQKAAKQPLVSQMSLSDQPKMTKRSKTTDEERRDQQRIRENYFRKCMKPEQNEMTRKT